MSIITVLSEGDAEETDAPERAATKGKQTAVRMVEARCSLGILRVPWAFCVFLGHFACSCAVGCKCVALVSSI